MPPIVPPEQGAQVAHLQEMVKVFQDERDAFVATRQGSCGGFPLPDSLSDLSTLIEVKTRELTNAFPARWRKGPNLSSLLATVGNKMKMLQNGRSDQDAKRRAVSIVPVSSMVANRVSGVGEMPGTGCVECESAKQTNHCHPVSHLRDVRSDQNSSDDEPLVRSAVGRNVVARVTDATSGTSNPRIVRSPSFCNNRFAELADEIEVATTIPALPQDLVAAGMVENAPTTIEDEVPSRATLLDSLKFDMTQGDTSMSDTESCSPVRQTRRRSRLVWKRNGSDHVPDRSTWAAHNLLQGLQFNPEIPSQVPSSSNNGHR